MTRVKKILFAALFLVVILDTGLVVGGLAHGHFRFENLPAFGAVAGFFLGCLVILVSVLLGRLGLVREEDYYD
jgi:hypothetical protein